VINCQIKRVTSTKVDERISFKMGKCYNCGGEIVFRYIDGKPTPIHTDTKNGWCGNDMRKSDSVKSITFDSFCTPTNCPQCGSSVFFLRHNGGSVWVDFLGKPWTKHACFDKTPEPQWIRKIREKSASLESPITGVIFSSARTDKGIQLIVNGQKSSWYEVVINEKNTADFFTGKLVLLDSSLMKVFFSDFSTINAVSINATQKPINHTIEDLKPYTKKSNESISLKEIKETVAQVNDDIQHVLYSAAIFALVNKNLSPYDDLIDGIKDSGIDVHAVMAWIFMVTGAFYENGKFKLNDDYNLKIFGTKNVNQELAMKHLKKFNSIKWTDLIPED